MRVFFSIVLALAVVAVALADTTEEAKTMVKQAIAYDQLDEVGKQSFVGRFQSPADASHFVSQIKAFWQKGKLVRLTSVKIGHDVRFDWIDLRFTVGKAYTGTDYIQRVYIDLDRPRERWRVVRTTDIVRAPIALVSLPGQISYLAR